MFEFAPVLHAGDNFLAKVTAFVKVDCVYRLVVQHLGYQLLGDRRSNLTNANLNIHQMPGIGIGHLHVCLRKRRRLAIRKPEFEARNGTWQSTEMNTIYDPVFALAGNRIGRK